VRKFHGIVARHGGAHNVLALELDYFHAGSFILHCLNLLFLSSL